MNLPSTAGRPATVRRRSLSLSVALFALLLTEACGQHPQPADQPKPQRAESPFADDSARFLAGLKGRSDGPYRKLETTSAWQTYSAEFGDIWNRLQHDQFDKVDEFQKRELEPVKTKSNFVFYPLSGPDVLYATHFFPDGKVFVFAGLERVGTLRSPESYRPETLEKDLRGYRWAVSSIVERSFFVTSEMDQQFHGKVADGLLPMIALLLARSGHTIDRYAYGKVTDAGEFVPEEPGVEAKKHQGVVIYFHRGADATPRTLYYFSRDLAADFEKNPAFSRFLRAQGTPDTLLKSASFLLHWQMCRALRQYVLDNSNLVLEDDTGVPYAYFRKANWQVQLFGEYSRPDKPFTREYQRDLAAAFQAPEKVRKLGFPLGYGAKRRPSSMILATRRTAVAKTVKD